MPHVDDDLPSWSELTGKARWSTVVIGNGASINV